MKTKAIRIFAILTLVSSASLCLAAKNADLKPVVAKPGKVLVDENFSDAKLGKNWMPNKGDWQTRDGTVVGKEKKEDNHNGVLLLSQPNRNSIIRFSFKNDGAKAFDLSYNHAKGHLFRVLVEKDGVVVNKDKDKKDAKSKNLNLGKAPGKFEPGQWYTMLVEVQGGKVVVQTDNGVNLTVTNSELDVDKIGYRFVVSGSSVAIADLKVWEAQPQ